MKIGEPTRPDEPALSPVTDARSDKASAAPSKVANAPSGLEGLTKRQTTLHMLESSGLRVRPHAINQANEVALKRGIAASKPLNGPRTGMTEKQTRLANAIESGVSGSHEAIKSANDEALSAGLEASKASGAKSWTSMPAEIRGNVLDLLSSPRDLSAISRASRQNYMEAGPLLQRDRLTHDTAAIDNLAGMHALLGNINALNPTLRGKPLAGTADRIEHMPLGERTQLFDAVYNATLASPQQQRGAPLARLGFQVADLKPDGRSERFANIAHQAGDGYKRKDLTAHDYGNTLAGLAYSLPSLTMQGDEHGAKVTDTINAIGSLPQSTQALPLSSVGYQISSLVPSARQPAFDAAWQHVAHLPGTQSGIALPAFASAIHSLPSDAGKQDGMNSVLSANSRLPLDKQGPTLSNASAQIGFLPEAGRTPAFNTVFASINPSHGRDYQSTLPNLATVSATLPANDRHGAFDRVYQSATAHPSPEVQSQTLSKLAEGIVRLNPPERFIRFARIGGHIKQLSPALQAAPQQALMLQFGSLTPEEQGRVRAALQR